MKIRMLLVAVSVLFLSSTAWAGTDFFGGYSFVNLDGQGGPRETVHGWMTNASFDTAAGVGIVGDLAGYYESGFNVHTYMGGLRYNAGMESVNAFAQALFGGAHLGGNSLSENGFAMGFGGGVDIPVADTISVRAVQFDWVPVHFSGDWVSGNVRLGWGIVFNLDE